MSRHVRRAVLLAIALVMIAATSVGANEFAAGYRTATNFDGLLGRQNIRTDPAPVANVGFVHPTQVDVGAQLGDFVAIGTYKGKGTTVPGAPNCADDFDSLWSIYRDGVLNGAYHCYTVAQDVYGIGANPSFEIRLTACSGTRWVLWFDGIQRACVLSSYLYASRVIVGIENASSYINDFNMDAKYTNLYKNYTGSGTWVVFGDCDSAPPPIVYPNYDVDGPGTTSCNTFLPPLD